MRPIQYAAAAALAALTLTACGGPSTATPAASSSDDGVTVGGTVTITSHLRWAGQEQPGSPCLGMAGMDDLAPNTPVRVATDADATLAMTALGQGQVTADGGCAFSWTATGVHLGDDAFYVVQVASREPVRVPRADLEGQRVALTI